ncbi:hypothetical protein BO94DRAFT_21077 [Aspergillus sclerotioniger CBS 115572]|uniref:Uncharacterized protein n=1 Tax=Aspergillus sclerotioniger CBS 115572 TaxID=1450535 RepID=A0A317WYB6_9EURO|nr:hypothetical protein BO94DRAFT_21077 [Aspergillus sclerotioniger CBS 115572]PWY90257.1 hypothetical protein BO94DRAFT_21077 [Aspergillus sclerotioniger CBS 115572]
MKDFWTTQCRERLKTSEMKNGDQERSLADGEDIKKKEELRVATAGYKSTCILNKQAIEPESKRGRRGRCQATINNRRLCPQVPQKRNRIRRDCLRWDCVVVRGKARARCTTRCNDAVCASVYVDVPGDSLGPRRRTRWFCFSFFREAGRKQKIWIETGFNDWSWD